MCVQWEVAWNRIPLDVTEKKTMRDMLKKKKKTYIEQIDTQIDSRNIYAMRMVLLC